MLKPRGFPETRASLLEAVRDGPDPGAWRRFFESYAPAVLRVAQLRGLSPHDADDVVQQVMMTVARSIHRFEYDRDRGRFRQWVRTVTENAIRTEHRRPHVSGGDAALETAEDPECIAQTWEDQWRLQDIVHCLDEIAADFAPRRVEAFRLYVVDGLPAEVVAERLGLHIGHVYVIRTEILNRLRARLRELDSDDEP